MRYRYPSFKYVAHIERGKLADQILEYRHFGYGLDDRTGIHAEHEDGWCIHCDAMRSIEGQYHPKPLAS
jgi:hypothetical protein